MYFAERMIGVATYLALLLFFSYLIGRVKKGEKKILIIYAIILSILAFFFIPNPGYDLERICKIIQDTYAQMSARGLVEQLGKTFTPTITVIYYVVAKIGIYGLLPMMASATFYACLFAVYYRICKKNNICGPKKSLLLFMTMSLGTYLEVICNLRCMTAFSIIAYCYYMEEYEEKKITKNIVLYLIASTIHLAGLAVTLLRIVLYPIQKRTKKITKIIFSAILITIVFTLAPNFINQIIFTKTYYTENVEYMYVPEFILMGIMTAYITMIKLIHFKDFRKDENIRKSIFFSTILLAIMVINIDNYSMFHRFGTLHFLISLPIMGYYISKIRHKTSIALLIIVCLIVISIAGYMGNLSGFKYFIIQN